jgi:hypothetical protein
MTTVCLAIGVGDAPPLDYLRGAVNGAHALADWANKQGYSTKLLTDEDDPVELADISDALASLLAGGADRLLLYFAGHGLSSGAADDLWLLSRWDDERKGVSVAALRDRLSRYGIGQLILIADACRTLLDTNTRDVMGDPVLPRGPFAERPPQGDLWFAASPARAAWMIPGPTPTKSRCIFSGLLMEALSGAYLQAFEGSDPSAGITNFSLADFLEARVPPLAARYGAALVPAITTSIRPPRNVYAPGVPTPWPLIEPSTWPNPSDVPITGMGALARSGRIQPWPGSSWSSDSGLNEFYRPWLTEEAPSLNAVLVEDQEAIAASLVAEKEVINASMADFQKEHRPTHFETGAGFAFSGAAAQEAFLGPAAKAQPHGKTGWWRIESTAAYLPSPWWTSRNRLSQPLPLLVQLTDGRWVGAAALPRFVLSFTVDELGAQAVIYRSMDSNFSFETERIMSRLRAGALRREEATELAGLLRGAKHADPMLGVLAAYLHDSMGDLANVRRTACYFAMNSQPIPFDIAILGRLKAHRDEKGLVRIHVPKVAKAEGASQIPDYMRSATPAIEGVVAGAFPWLRQGWVRLDPKGRRNLYPAELAKITPHLLQGPFTTLTARGGAMLAQLLFSVT